MKINQKQIESVLALCAHKRFEHFIKIIVDWEEVWGLYSDNRVLIEINDTQKIFPVWPAKEYATLYAIKELSNYTPKRIFLSEFIDNILPSMRCNDIFIGVFYTPFDKGLTLTVDETLNSIKKELENY